MKKLMMFLLCGSLVFPAYSQFKIATNGSTSIFVAQQAPYALFATQSNTAIRGFRTSYNLNGQWGYGVLGESETFYTDYSVGVCGKAKNRSGNSCDYSRAYGVLGEAGHARTGGNYGIFGRLISGSWGAAVYGTVSSADSIGTIIGNRFAGYFNGGVCITDNLEVLRGISCNDIYSCSSNEGSSAMSLSAERESLSDKLATLSAVPCYERQPSATATASVQVEETGVLSAMDLQRAAKKHYRLSAEELETVLPDVVYTKEDGTKLINYTELIPVLVQSIAELKAEIAELRGEDDALFSKQKVATGLSGIGQDGLVLSLSQNKPNPWNARTDIQLCVPESVKLAVLYFYDMGGKQVHEIRLTERGTQTVSLSAGTFSPGMYLYSLVADGQIVGTRRMILTR